MKRCPVFLALALAALMAGISPLGAEVQFETRSTSYQAQPEEESFEVHFPFSNEGDHPIVIQKVDTNCGCIRADTDKERYEPGEKGTVTAVFKIGGAEGIQTKNVTLIWAEELPVVKPKVLSVAGDDNPPLPPRVDPSDPALGPAASDRLTVEVHVPVLLEIEPKITKWAVGDAAETKIVQVIVNRDEPIVIKDVRSSRPNVAVVTKELERGKRYQLELTPTTTESVQLGMLTIETDCELPQHRKKLAFFSIHRPAPDGLPPIRKQEPARKPDLAGEAETNAEVSDEVATGAGDRPSS